MTHPDAHRFDSDHDFQDHIHGPDFWASDEAAEYEREQQEALLNNGECDHITYEQWNRTLIRLLDDGEHVAHEVTTSLKACAAWKMAAALRLMNAEWAAMVAKEKEGRA